MRQGYRLLLMLIFTLCLGCQVRLEPGALYWAEPARGHNESQYYREKARDLVHQLANTIGQSGVQEVVVLDAVNDAGQVSALGEYFSGRVVEAITQAGLFRVVKRGEVERVLETLRLAPALSDNREELGSLGCAFEAEALLTGRITDLGTGLDVRLTLTDVENGDLIAAATEHLKRSRFALEMYRHTCPPERNTAG